MFSKKDKEKDVEEEALKKFSSRNHKDTFKSKKKTSRNLFSFKGFVKASKLKENLVKAGMEDNDRKVVKNLAMVSFVICLIINLVAAYLNFSLGRDVFNLLIFSVAFWPTVFPLLLVIIAILFLAFLDMRIYKRKKEIEEVFPDFLQLTSSNISAGMPVDKALWYAVRPNFGVLAKEIEKVAKDTLTGKDLSLALKDFAEKYDSKTIRRSISLINEGMAAGGEMSALLSKISIDIEETKIMKQEMAASVTTYVIFITFATIVASPLLFGLSFQLVNIIKDIAGGMSTLSSGGGGFFSLSFSADAIKMSDFQIFVYTMLVISSFFSAAIISAIKKGKVRDGLSQIPIFIIVSIVVFTISYMVMGSIFSGII
jgi:Flp pilus assembly protein TadB